MIKRVRICNFKSLGDVTVDLEPITVLIGRSGTGKTNFVEALRFLRDCLNFRNELRAMDAYGGWERVPCATAAKPIRIFYDLTFTAPGFSEDYNYTLLFQSHDNQQLPHRSEEKLTLGEQTLFHLREQEWIQPPRVLHPPAPNGLMLGAISGIQEITIAYLMLTSAIGCYDFPSTILQQSQPAEAGIEGLADRGENALQVFQTLVSNLSSLNHWRNIVASLRCLNCSIQSIDMRLPEKSAITVSHAVGNQALVLDLAQESEGLRRFLAHLLALYQTPPKQTLIFEEPEKGIHPRALAALAGEFKLCSTKRGGQIILTTHSPELLNQFSAESIRVVEMIDSQTQIGSLVADQFESLKEHLLEPGELLTVDPARLITDPVPVG